MTLKSLLESLGLRKKQKSFIIKPSTSMKEASPKVSGVAQSSIRVPYPIVQGPLKLEDDISNDESEKFTDEDQEVEFRKRLQVSTTFAECWEVVEECSEEESLLNEALEKALSLANTDQECDDVRQHQYCPDSLSEMAQSRIVKFFLTKLEKATSSSEVIDIETEAHDSFEVELDSDMIVRKALFLAKNVGDCQSIIDDRSWDNDEDDGSLDEIFAKMITFFATVEECEELWNEEGIDTKSGRVAICRAAEIIRSEIDSEDSEPSTRAASPPEN